MFSKFKAYFTKGIDDLISDVSSTVERLHVVAAAHAAAAKVHAAEIEVRTKLLATADAEETRAKRIAAKLTELVS